MSFEDGYRGAAREFGLPGKRNRGKMPLPLLALNLSSDGIGARAIGGTKHANFLMANPVNGVLPVRFPHKAVVVGKVRPFGKIGLVCGGGLCYPQAI